MAVGDRRPLPMTSVNVTPDLLLLLPVFIVLLLLLLLSLFALVSYYVLFNYCYSAIRLLSRKCAIKLDASVSGYRYGSQIKHVISYIDTVALNCTSCAVLLSF